MLLALVFAASPLVDKALFYSGLTTLDTWYGHVGEVALSTLLWLTSWIVAVWLSLVITPPLCAPALERLVRAEEEHLGAPPRPKLSIWVEWGCGAQAQAVSLLGCVSAWGLLTAIDLTLPALAVVTLPLKVLAVSAALAWSLLDYPLTLRGVRAGTRVRLFATQPLAVVSFGLPFACLFWFPFVSVLLLPVGAMAATRVVWQLARQDPTWQAALTHQDAGKTAPPRRAG
jgi:hypothetical protein